MSLDWCQWPPLGEPYAEALNQVVRFILERFPDTLGIIASGTILRGTASASSDLDVYVIRRRAQRQRLQYRFNGVPAEIFANPPALVYAYMEQETAAARPITAHMLATGFTILDLDPVVSRLQERAREVLAAGPSLSPQQLTTARYMAAAQFEDATDIADARRETARMILNLAVHAMLRYRFLKAGRFLPRDKDLLTALDELDPELASAARSFYGGAGPGEIWDLGQRIADLTIGTRGFFEWESEPEDLTVEPGPSKDTD